MSEPGCRTIRGLIKEHPVLVVEAPAPAILKLNALEDDSAPILRSEILPIEKGSIITDLHELDDRLDHFRRLRVVGRHIGRHVELDREPWRCHGNSVAWVARNRGKRVRSDGQSSVRMDNLTSDPPYEGRWRAPQETSASQNSAVLLPGFNMVGGRYCNSVGGSADTGETQRQANAGKAGRRQSSSRCSVVCMRQACGVGGVQ